MLLYADNSFSVFSCFFMQLKVYARVQGKPKTWDKKDMVFVSLGYAYDKDLTEHVVLPRSQIGERLMLAAFVCLTTLIGLILMWLTTAYYKMFVHSTKTARKSLYQATVLVFCCANIFNFGVFVIACLFKHPNLHTTDEVVVTAFTLKMVMIPVLLILHLLVTVFVVRTGPEPHSRFISRVLQALALFQILIFIQTIGAASIPLFVFLLLYTYRVLSALVFVLSGTFCLIVFTANLLLFFNPSADRKCQDILVPILQAFTTLVFLIAIGVLVVFYLLLLSRGVHTEGLQGFLLSLLPSAIMTAAGWYVKEKVLKRRDVK